MAEKGQPDMVALGKIVGAHGIRGEIKVISYSGSLGALEGKGRVFVRQTGGVFKQRDVLKEWRLLSVQPYKAGFLLVLKGIDDRDGARGLAGAELMLPREELPALDEDEYYWYELVGLEVVTPQGERLGQVGEIMATGAADVLVIRGEGGEFLVPATPEVVKSVALSEGRMVIEPPEGLMPEGSPPEGATPEGSTDEGSTDEGPVEPAG
jgi:16S rRNA processing protein RimM